MRSMVPKVMSKMSDIIPFKTIEKKTRVFVCMCIFYCCHTGGLLFRDLVYASEDRFAKYGHRPPWRFLGIERQFSLCMVARWIHQHSQCGNIEDPCDFEARAGNMTVTGNGEV